MVNTVNNNPGVNRAFSNLVQNNPALKRATPEDATAVKRLYVNGKGDVKQSSNAISHAFRKLLGKPVGLDALSHALTQQVGESKSGRLLDNLMLGGKLKSLGDIDDVVNSAKFDEPEVKDFDADAVRQARLWQALNAKKV